MQCNVGMYSNKEKTTYANIIITYQKIMTQIDKYIYIIQFILEKKNVLY